MLQAAQRYLPRAALSLVLGLGTSVAVAWAIAAWAPLPMQPPMMGGSFMHWDRVWHAVVRRSTGREIINWGWATSDYITAPLHPNASDAETTQYETRIKQMTSQQILDELRENTLQVLAQRPGYVMHDQPASWGTFSSASLPAEPMQMGADWSFGWPKRSLWFQVRARRSLNTVSGDVIEGGRVIAGMPSAVLHNFRALPLWPLWNGLIVNTLIYASIWFALLSVPAIMQRRLRIRRGRCPKCGYVLHPDAHRGCPECGHDR